MKNLIYSFLIILAISGCNSTTKSVKIISSTPGIQWQELEQIIKPVSKSNNESIIIYADKTQQQIDGFGACFNELGWEALSVISEQERNAILQEFFNPEKGFKLNICRMPIGANDYAIDWYSFNETPDDFEMSEFSIERDQQRLVPYIKKALEINPNLKIWGSPWCPPSWMKTNMHYACRPDVVNDLSPEGEGTEMVM